jgi:hypothetical protein
LSEKSPINRIAQSAWHKEHGKGRSTKFQASNIKQIPITQIQNVIVSVIRDWELKFIWDLEFVIWNFGA